MNIKKMTPVLDAINIEETEDFYCNMLGFKKLSEDLTKDGKPYWMHLVSNAAELMLYQAYEPEQIERKRQSGFYDFVLYFEVDALESMHQTLKERGLKVSDVGDTKYGMKEFYLRDPNGHQLTFGQAIQAEMNIVAS